MAISPESMPQKPFDFRAPPPSPIASGRRSCFTNNDVLTEFLEHSVRVPHLVLPDKVFPKQKFIEDPPKIDFQLLTSQETQWVKTVLDAIATIGCFQLVNYGISVDFIKSVSTMAAGIFRVPLEKRDTVMKSFEKPYGYEEGHGEEENQFGEEFVWCRDEKLKLDMERIWPIGYSNFSEKMERLMGNIEKIGEKIIEILRENWRDEKMEMREEMVESVCYVEKQKVLNECEWVKDDVIRTVIRGIDYSHALGLHICHGSSLFHLYSKKAWFSFSPDQEALLITVGDQIQVMSGGQYKHVIGRPIYKAGKDELISMAFLIYSPPSPCRSPNQKKEKTISISQQAMVAIILTLFYHFLLHFYHNF